jgi:hypothetical protein
MSSGRWGFSFFFLSAEFCVADFVSLRQAFDLGGKFVNPYVERALGI